MLQQHENVGMANPVSDGLTDVLKTENVQLRQGLVNIQTNLAESVAANLDNIKICRQIEEHCVRLSDESESVRSDTDECSHSVS